MVTSLTGTRADCPRSSGRRRCGEVAAGHGLEAEAHHPCDVEPCASAAGRSPSRLTVPAARKKLTCPRRSPLLLGGAAGALSARACAPRTRRGARPLPSPCAPPPRCAATGARRRRRAASRARRRAAGRRPVTRSLATFSPILSRRKVAAAVDGVARHAAREGPEQSARRRFVNTTGASWGPSRAEEGHRRRAWSGGRRPLVPRAASARRRTSTLAVVLPPASAATGRPGTLAYEPGSCREPPPVAITKPPVVWSKVAPSLVTRASRAASARDARAIAPAAVTAARGVEEVEVGHAAEPGRVGEAACGSSWGGRRASRASPTRRRRPAAVRSLVCSGGDAAALHRADGDRLRRPPRARSRPCGPWTESDCVPRAATTLCHSRRRP